MSYLINPHGRMVACDDPKMIEELLTKGFKRPSPAQEQAHIKERYAILEQQKITGNNDKSIYFSTVSQGGKDGYSIASGAIIKELKKLGVDISTYNKNQPIAVLFHNPYSILRIESAYRIIYTMFESSRIPDNWKDYLEAADMVIVPSKWCASVFKNAGIDAKVVPLGYDDTVYEYKERPNRAQNHEPFTFIHYNAFNLRKGFTEVFRAFVEEFKHLEPVRMIFKTTLDTLPLPISKEKYPNIEIVQGKTEDSKILELLYKSDCFVFPSRGEGFGMTPLEAMATGIPAIVPNAHGITEYFNPEYMYEVRVKETCPGIYSSYKGQNVGTMIVCDVEDLRRKMRYVYEHQDEAKIKGMKAAEYVKQWTFKKTAQNLKDIFSLIQSRPGTLKPIKNILPLTLVK